MFDPLPASDALDPEDLPDNLAVFVPVNSDVTQVMAYRAGFQDGADGRNPARTAYAYERGYIAGERFRERVSGTTPYPAYLDPHFPGWTIAEPQKLPRALYWHSSERMGGYWKPIVLVLGRHGGDRKSAAFKARAALP